MKPFPVTRPSSSSSASSPSARPRPSLNVNLATPSNYPVLFSPKSPPALRKKHSELALRLGDVMGEIHRHEKEKREIAGFSQRRLAEDATARRPSGSVGVADWKPYEERKQRGAGETLKGELDVKKSTLAHPHSPVEIVSRDGVVARAIDAVLSDVRYQALSIALTLLCLYLHDLCYAVMPKSADEAVSAILLAVFILFSVELLVQCLVRRHYFLSFFFFMDLIGTASLIFDIQFITDALWSESSLTSSSTPSSHVTQSASVIRLTRFARLLRVIRLVRIVRLLRHHTAANQSRHPSKVGLHLAGLIDKRVILMMLGMVIILPFLTADPSPDDQSPALALELMVDSQSSADLQTVFAQLVSAQGDALYYAFIQGGPVAGASGLTLIDYRAAQSGLRVEEQTVWTDGSSTLLISVRQSVYLTACYSMATTTLIIVVFALGSWLISRNVHSLVVAPLERMTQIIRKLAGTVCFLTAATEADAKELDTGLETNVIEATIEKMARIFAVQPDGNNALPKPLQMMAGSKHTEIMTNSSIVSIEVVERPKALQNEVIVDDGSVSDDRSQWLDVDFGVHRELSSIDEILTHPLLIPYFELYLASCFVVENLQFSLEVDRFRSIIRTHALHLHNSFISARAHNAINVESKTKQSIADSLDEPSYALFDEAQRECLDGMRGHWRSFLRSRWCRTYIRKAEEVEARRQRMAARKPKNIKGFFQELKRASIPSDSASVGGDVEPVHILPGTVTEAVNVPLWLDGEGSEEVGVRDRAASDDRYTRGARRRGTGEDFPGAVNGNGRLKEDE